ncbi:MAG TPA: transposase [Bacteroidota bacterium]
MKTKTITLKPPRWDQNNSIYFLTFCTFDRKPYLHRGLIPGMIIDNLIFYAKRLNELIAYTVMPDHVHLLAAVAKVEHMSDYLRDFKKHTSKEIKKILCITPKHVWQRGTMDHCIRVTPENTDYVNHLNYTYYNSMKHLGIAPKDFSFHNFKEAVRKEWIVEGFASNPPVFPQKFEMYE